MRTVKIAFCMLAETLACVLLPLAVGRAAESDVVTPVAVAVCALTLGPAIFAFFLGTDAVRRGAISRASITKPMPTAASTAFCLT